MAVSRTTAQNDHGQDVAELESPQISYHCNLVQIHRSEPCDLGDPGDHDNLPTTSVNHVDTEHHLLSNVQTVNTDNKHGFTLHEVDGDLFENQVPGAYCQSVSRDCAMKKGIATQFKCVFKDLNSINMQKMAKVKGVGGIVVIKDRNLVYNLITKEKYFHKPVSMHNLVKCIRKMRNHARAHNVSRINMPKISSGHDGLKWIEVERIIKRIFKNEEISIYVYNFDPKLKNSQDIGKIGNIELEHEDLDYGNVIENLRRKLEDANKTIDALNSKLEEVNENKLNIIERDVNQLKSSLLSLMAQRGEDKSLIDKLERQVESVDEGCDTLVTIIKDKIEDVENKLSNAFYSKDGIAEAVVENKNVINENESETPEHLAKQLKKKEVSVGSLDSYCSLQ